EAQAGDGRGRRRGSARRGGDLLAPTVVELDQELGVVRMDRVGEAAVRGHHLGEEAADGVRGQQAGRVGGGRLDEDRSGAAAGAGLVVGDEVAGGEVVV